MSSVLVTGGAGFIGANLIRNLLADRYAVRVLDDFSTGSPSYLQDVAVDVVTGSVTNPESVLEATEGMDAIVHLAAMSGVTPSIDEPRRDFDINVFGTFNALDAARTRGIRTFVFASSGAVLAGAEPPLHEDLKPSPLSPYGTSKAYGEFLTQTFSRVYGLAGIALRFSNVYGDFCSHKQSVIATFLRKAAYGEPLVIYGDGRQTRDFVHVADISAGIRRALATDRGGVFHLSTGVETSVLELVSHVGEVSGRALEVEHRSARRGEAQRNFADCSLAREILGWNPSVGIDHGLKSTYRWIVSDMGGVASGA